MTSIPDQSSLSRGPRLSNFLSALAAAVGASKGRKRGDTGAAR